MIIVGAGCAAFSIECFLIPNTILDGGVTGVSMMINYLSGVRLSILVIVINIPFFYVGFRALGKRFLARAVLAMAAFSGFLELFKLVPTVTSSELLAVVFGGVLLGIGVGTVLRHGGCLDGTEIAAMLLSKHAGVSTGQIIFTINIFIYVTAGVLFGWDRAMLSLLTYFITFKIIDVVQEGMEQVVNSPYNESNYLNFIDCAWHVAGKTGTAQKGENITNDAIFICYGPYDDPEIAVAVVVERGGSGAGIVHIARQIMDAYINIRSYSDTSESEMSLLR